MHITKKAWKRAEEDHERMRFISGICSTLCLMVCSPTVALVATSTSASPAAQKGTMALERPMFAPPTDAAMYMPNMPSRRTPTATLTCTTLRVAAPAVERASSPDKTARPRQTHALISGETQSIKASRQTGASGSCRLSVHRIRWLKSRLVAAFHA